MADGHDDSHQRDLARSGISTFHNSNANERYNMEQERIRKENQEALDRVYQQQQNEMDRKQREENRAAQAQRDKDAAAKKAAGTKVQPPASKDQERISADRTAFVLAALAVGGFLHFGQAVEPVVAGLGGLVAGAFAYKFWRPALALAAVGGIGYFVLKDDLAKKSGSRDVAPQPVAEVAAPTAPSASRVERVGAYTIPEGGWLRIVKGGERLLVADHKYESRFDWYGLWRRFAFDQETYCDAFSVKELDIKTGAELFSGKVADLCWIDIPDDTSTWAAVSSRGEIVLGEARDWSVTKKMPVEHAKRGPLLIHEGHAFVLMKHELAIQKVSLETGKVVLTYRVLQHLGDDAKAEQPQEFWKVNVLEGGQKIVAVTDSVGELGASANYRIIFDAVSGDLLNASREDFASSQREESTRFVQVGLGGFSSTRDRAVSKDGTYEYLQADKKGALVRTGSDEALWRHELPVDPLKVSFSDDNRFLVWSDYTKGFGVIDAATGEIIATREHDKMWFLAFSADGSEMYTCCREENKTFSTSRIFERWALR